MYGECSYQVDIYQGTLPGIERIELRQKICNTRQHPKTNFICLFCYIEKDP